MVYTNYVPRPSFVLMHGLSFPTIEAAREDARHVLAKHPEVDHVELTDGYTVVFETLRRGDTA